MISGKCGVVVVKSTPHNHDVYKNNTYVNVCIIKYLSFLRGLF